MQSTAITKIQRKHALKDIKTEGNVAKSALRTSIDIGLGVLGGGVVGAALGKPSFVAGLLMSGYGYYANSGVLPAIGLGMMASNSGTLIQQPAPSVNGFDMNHELSNAKHRLLSFKDNLLSKLYVDKLQKAISNEEEETTAPVSEEVGRLGALSLEDIEQQLLSSAMEHQSQGEQVAGTDKLFTPYEGDTDIDEEEFSSYEII